MITRLALALLLTSQSLVVQFRDMVIVRRQNFVVGATVDGYICYGTHEPLTTHCHRAVADIGEGLIANEMPKAPLSVRILKFLRMVTKQGDTHGAATASPFLAFQTGTSDSNGYL